MKRLPILILALALCACGSTNNSSVNDGNKYVPYSQREGSEAVVYFTRNLSPEGLIAAYEKVNGEITGKVGILSSTDILAVDQACIDIIYAMTADEHKDIVERIETRHGLRQLSYMKELGMGHDKYILIDLDNDGKQITAADAAKGLKPFTL